MFLSRNRNVQTTATALFALGLFLVIAGGRLLLLRLVDTDIPQFDSWAVEGENLYRPFISGHLSVSAFFTPCNEHRVALSLLLSLMLLIMNGLWDNQLQTVVNALLYSAIGVGIFFCAARYLAVAPRIIWAIVIAVTFTLPFGWENAIWGFQSQFYLMMALSMAVIHVATPEGIITRRRLAVMVALQMLAPFTTSAGSLAAAAVVGGCLCFLVRNRNVRAIRHRLLLQAAISGAMVVLGIAASHVSVPLNEYQAETIADFMRVLGDLISWPLPTINWWWLVNWLPWVGLLAAYLKGAVDDGRAVRFCIAGGIWVLLQSAAVAYSRNSIALHSKYLDPIAMGLLFNALALALLHGGSSRRVKQGLVVFALCWGAGNGYALNTITTGIREVIIPEKQRIYAMQRQKTRAFLETGNEEFLAFTGKHETPHRDADQYARLLADPVINRILPPSINIWHILTHKPSALLSRIAGQLREGAWSILLGGLAFLFAGTVASFYHTSKAHAKRQEEADMHGARE